MWREIVDYFHDSPQRLRVAQAIIRHGFRVEAPGVIKCRSIRIPLKAMGEALEVDRRTVQMTTERICQSARMKQFFSNLEPAGPSLEKVSKFLGYGVVVIFVESPQNVGILSEVTSTIAGYRVPIRQIIAEDVAIYEEPCLKVVTERPLPGAVIDVLTSIRGVKKVIIEK
jgi:predicted regulator of amino acid metabolism with ACT domain